MNLTETIAELVRRRDDLTAAIDALVAVAVNEANAVVDRLAKITGVGPRVRVKFPSKAQVTASTRPKTPRTINVGNRLVDGVMAAIRKAGRPMTAVELAAATGTEARIVTATLNGYVRKGRYLHRPTKGHFDILATDLARPGPPTGEHVVEPWGNGYRCAECFTEGEDRRSFKGVACVAA